jgi:hypothetical protein
MQEMGDIIVVLDRHFPHSTLWLVYTTNRVQSPQMPYMHDGAGMLEAFTGIHT